MTKQFPRVRAPAATAIMCTVAALLGGCAGNGVGLDANGNPVGSGSGSGPTALTADFQSIQDNIFTPICTRCHIGANAPEGLQLDAAHSYALLVGVPSAEVPSVQRVKAGDPADSYLIQKLQGSGGIVGQQMPYGGPYLPQSTIDVVRTWITNGAAAAAASGVSHQQVRTAAASSALSVIATMPADTSDVTGAVANIAIGLSEAPDLARLNSAVSLHKLGAQPLAVPVLIATAPGNSATVLLTPVAPLAPGAYRVTLQGGAGGLTGLAGAPLAADYTFTFNVDTP